MTTYKVRFYVRGMARMMVIEARSIGDAKAAIRHSFRHVSFASVEVAK